MKLKQKILMIAITFAMSYSCQAQLSASLPEQISIYSTEIIGTWVDEEDNNYKLVFLSNGNCKEYDGSQLVTTYNYSITQASCANYNSRNSFYLKWFDTEDSQTSCLEILNITDNALSLMIVDKAERLFLVKE